MSLTLTNTELKSRIGHMLGYGDVVSSFDSEQTDNVNRCFDEGKRNFYSPSVNGAAYQWSFLSPTIPFDLSEGKWRFDLPTDFAMIRGPLTFSAGSNVIHRPIDVTSAERVQREQHTGDCTGTPTLAAVRPKQHNEGDFLDAMHYELIVWPTPEQDYTIDLCYRINPLAPTGGDLLPIGDVYHVQTLLEACLAAGERFDGTINGPHAIEFQSRLMASVSHDRMVACPETLGQNLDQSDRYEQWGSWRDYNTYVVTTPWG